MTPRRPRLALPFTFLADDEVLHLVAGEDVRYTLRAGASSHELAQILARCDGQRTLAEVLAGSPDPGRLEPLLERLAGERLLVEGPVEAAHRPALYQPRPEGTGALVALLARSASALSPIAILCQDTLDLSAVLAFNRRCLRANAPFLWVTTGPVARGYVSPVFLPDAGPCLACLLGQFRRLSPAPHLHDALLGHGEQGGTFTPTSFPAEGITLLEQVARWKVAQLDRPIPPSAVFRLHVLELETMEVRLHRVFVDPTCAECQHARLGG